MFFKTQSKGLGRLKQGFRWPHLSPPTSAHRTKPDAAPEPLNANTTPQAHVGFNTDQGLKWMVSQGLISQPLHVSFCRNQLQYKNTKGPQGLPQQHALTVWRASSSPPSTPEEINTGVVTLYSQMTVHAYFFST